MLKKPVAMSASSSSAGPSLTKQVDVVIGDSNCSDIADKHPVVYLRAVSKADFDQSLSEVEAMNPPPAAVYISSLLNFLPRKKNVDDRWKPIVEGVVEDIKTFCLMMQSTTVLVQLPYFRRNHKWIRKNFNQVREYFTSKLSALECQNLMIDKLFQVTQSELLLDKVHLKPAVKHRLYVHITSIIECSRPLCAKKLDAESRYDDPFKMNCPPHSKGAIAKSERERIRRRAEELAKYGDASHPEEKERFGARIDYDKQFLENRFPDVHVSQLWQNVVPPAEFFVLGNLPFGLMKWRLESGCLSTNLNQVRPDCTMPRVIEILPGQLTIKNEDHFAGIASIKAEGLMAFDTERQDPPYTLQIGAPCNVVWIYHIPDDVDAELASLLSNPHVRKVQVGSFQDKLNIQSKVHVNGEVDLSHLIKLYLTPAAGANDSDNSVPKSGIDVVAKLMKESRMPFFVGHNNRRIYGEGKLDKKSMVHAVQDVHLPIAGVYHIVKKICTDCGFKDDENILPLLHYVLNGVVELPSAQPNQSYWTEAFRNGKEMHIVERPHAFFNLTRFLELHYKHAYYLPHEQYQLPEFGGFANPTFGSLEERRDIALKFWPDPSKLPCRSDCQERRLMPDPDRCNYCGLPGHSLWLHDNRGDACHYPLCRKSGHDIGMCPVLHLKCRKCGMRGHEEHHHKQHMILDLEEIFIRYSTYGKFTCLIYLEMVEEYRPYLRERHWRWSLHGQKRCLSQKLFHRFGITYSLLPEVKKYSERELHDHNRQRQRSQHRSQRKK